MSTDTSQMTDQEIKRRQAKRNIAVALAVLGFMVVVYLVTIVRIDAGVQASLERQAQEERLLNEGAQNGDADATEQEVTQ